MALTPSERLKQAIKNSNLTHTQLADKVGLGKSSIQRYSSGETKKISVDIVDKLAPLLGVTTAYIMGWEDVNGHSLKQTPDPNWQPSITKKDERTIQERLEEIKLGIGDGANAANDGLGLHEYSENTQRAVMSAIEVALTAMALERKERFTPNKYKQVKEDS